MDEPFPAEVAPALAELTAAAKDEHDREEQARQDELQAAVLEMLGDNLTARGYAAWRRDHDEPEQAAQN
jgi:hypothetical protein